MVSCIVVVMRLHRFFVSQPLGEDVVIDTVSLIDQWKKVFRYTAGQEVILFNGDGFEVVYEIKELSKSQASLERKRTDTGVVPKKSISLYVSLIKKDNVELLTQKAVELGVSSIHFIVSSRVEKRHISFERLRIIATEALEQCLRADTFTIHEPVSLEAALASTENVSRFVLQMGGEPFLEATRKSNGHPQVFFVGPEGGWSPEDLALFNNHSVPAVSLSHHVLRAETSAIACATLACY